MDYYDIIAGRFQTTLNNIAMSVDSLARPMEQASHLLLGSLLADGKIICCGSGVDHALAQLLCANLLGRYQQERPALPALCLGAEAASLEAMAAESGSEGSWARQLRALGQAGDTLVLVHSGGDESRQALALEAARERNMRVIALSNTADGQVANLLGAEDVLLVSGAAQRAQVVELHTMILNTLCELVDLSLFGNYNQE
jgi:phosphoheptose isomerase